MSIINTTTKALKTAGFGMNTQSIRVDANGDVYYWTANPSTDLRATKPWAFKATQPSQQAFVSGLEPGMYTVVAGWATVEA